MHPAHRNPLHLARAVGNRLQYTGPFLKTLGQRLVKPRQGNPVLWIHIGAHKTGTTTLQRALDQERHSLMAHSIWFDPESIDFGEHLSMHSPLAPAELERCKAEMRGRIERRREDAVIWSSEFFFGDPELGYRNIGAVAADLRSITEGYEVRIIASVRRQDEFIESWYHQHVKRGGCDSFQQFLTRVGEGSFQWPALLAEYEARFGKEHLRVHLFEHFRKEAPPMLEYFFGGLGIPFKIHHLPAPEFNPSFSRKALELALRCFPELEVPERKRLRNALMQAFPRLPGEKFNLLAPEERESIKELCRESNLRCFEQWFGGASEAAKWGYLPKADAAPPAN